MAEQRQLQAAVKAAVVGGIATQPRGRDVTRQVNAAGCGTRGAVEEIIDIDPVGHHILDGTMTLLGWTPPTLGEVQDMIQAFTFGERTSCGDACSWINKMIIESNLLEAKDDKNSARRIIMPHHEASFQVRVDETPT